MLRLLLLRHAKSAWNEPGLSDIDRPLAPRGERAARVMAAAIDSDEYRPTRILCSPARRTRETLAPLAERLGKKVPVATVAGLYEPPSGDYRAAIAGNGGKAERLLLVGHNPATQATARALAGGGDSGLREAIAEKFPTGALAVIDFDAADWAGLRPQSGRIVAFLTPKALAHQGDDVGED